eukprot:gene15184-16746_t
MVLLSLIVFSCFIINVSGYCAPGTDTTLDVIKPLKNQKVKVVVGGETTLQVRYNGQPQVRWYLNAKRIPMTTKSKHFEFVKGGASFNQIGQILKIKDFKKPLAGTYKVVIDKTGCINTKIIKVELDTTFSLQRSIASVFKKAPFLETKAGTVLLFLGFAFVFIIIPITTCCALCSKSRKLKKELDSEKGKLEMFHDYDAKKKSHKSKPSRKKEKERQALIAESSSSSSSEDLPNARPHGKDNKHNGRSK